MPFIRVDADAVTIGAATTHAEVADSRRSRIAPCPRSQHLAHLIGDPAVRHKGTLGGSLANNDPAADYPAAALALECDDQNHRRSFAADDFFTGMFSTALDDGEIVTEISFPLAERAAYSEIPQSGLALCDGRRVRRENERRRARRRHGRSAMRVPPSRKWKPRSRGISAPDAIAAIKVDASNLNSDIHGSAEYRANLVSVMAKRAVAAAIK